MECNVPSIKLFAAIPTFASDPTKLTFAHKPLLIGRSPENIAVISSTPDRSGKIVIDNFMAINGVNACQGVEGQLFGDSCFGDFILDPADPAVLGMPIDSVLTPIPAIDVRTFIPVTTTEVPLQAVQFELRDLGSIGGNTDLYLATTATVIEIETVNSLAAGEAIRSTFSTVQPPTPQSCPSGFKGKFFFSASFRNTSQNTLSNLVIEVNKLTEENLLDIPGAKPQGVLALLIVQRTGAYGDGELSPGEAVVVPFGICLKEIRPFQFFVDLLGSE